MQPCTNLLFSVILSSFCFLTGSNDDHICKEEGHLGLLMIGGNDGAANKSVDLITCEIMTNQYALIIFIHFSRRRVQRK